MLIRATGSIAVLLALGALTPVGAQSTANAQQDEQAIRAEANRWTDVANSGKKVSEFYEPGAVFVSGAFARPVILPDSTMPMKRTARAKAEERKNQKTTQTIRRVTVSKSGDMAWEYNDFEVEYDDANTGKHIKFPGSTLRVWHKVDGKWRIAAMFARPNEE